MAKKPSPLPMREFNYTFTSLWLIKKPKSEVPYLENSMQKASTKTSHDVFLFKTSPPLFSYISRSPSRKPPTTGPNQGTARQPCRRSTCSWVEYHEGESLEKVGWDKNLVKPEISAVWNMMKYWLVVSTHLKNISQNGNLPQIGVKIKNVWNHHPE